MAYQILLTITGVSIPIGGPSKAWNPEMRTFRETDDLKISDRKKILRSLKAGTPVPDRLLTVRASIWFILRQPDGIAPAASDTHQWHSNNAAKRRSDLQKAGVLNSEGRIATWMLRNRENPLFLEALNEMLKNYPWMNKTLSNQKDKKGPTALARAIEQVKELRQRFLPLPEWYSAWLAHLKILENSIPLDQAVASAFVHCRSINLIEHPWKYWLIVNNETQQVRLIERDEFGNWDQRVIEFSQGRQEPPTISETSPWQSEERNAFERILVAWASLLHGTSVFRQPLFRNFDPQLLLRPSPNAGNEPLTLENLGFKLMSFSRPAMNIILRTRTTPAKALDEWSQHLKEVTTLLHNLVEGDILSEENVPQDELRKNLRKHADMYEATTAIAAGLNLAGMAPIGFILDPLIHFFTERYTVNSLHLTWSIPEDLRRLCLRTQPFVAGLLVENLLNNAISWAMQSENSRVHLFARLYEGDVEITVSDNGPGGNSEAWQDPIVGRTGRKNGHGIGLPLVRYLVELMDGRLEVQSSHAGTRVSVTLPVRAAA